MTFGFDISSTVWILMAVCALCALAAAIIGLRNMRALARKGRRMMTDDSLPGDDGRLPGVSVIVYAKNEEERIREYLAALLKQEYPEYEVIVINDASIDNTAGIVEAMLEEDERLRFSFVPESSRNVSRRKVAFTIGAKAAKYPVLLITAANTEIPSPQWLRRMAAPFEDPGVEVVLGTSFFPRENHKGAGRWYRQFDSLSVLSQWLGSALAGAPYRGDAYALAYRRQTFFDRNGFALTNRFVAGEDDIFINTIATPENTVVALHPDAMLRRVLPTDEYPRLWLREKERYTFTQRYLETWALRRQAGMSLALWLGLLAGVAAAVLALPNLFPACAVLFTLLLLWSYQICLYRRAARLMQSVRLFWSVPIFWLMRPLFNALLRIRFSANKSTNYTWQHAK